MGDQDFRNHGAHGDHLPMMDEVTAEATDHKSDAIGHRGKWGGQLVPEVLMAVIDEVTDGYAKTRVDQDFLDELDQLQHTYVGHLSPLYYAEKSSANIGVDVWLKREDLNHTGSRKVNNILGQVLFTRRMGRKNIIAEIGAGQHSVATATTCVLPDPNCRIYMGKVDAIRQRLNIVRMRLFGAEVIEVEVGSETLKGTTNGAMRFWVSYTDDTYYCFSAAAGPHPFPTMVRDFRRIISAEARQQILTKTGSLPDAVVACVGGGSNAISAFHHFIGDESVCLTGTEASGDGVETGRHTAPISAAGNPGVFQGSFATLMQNEDGQIAKSHSISAGLDYPGVGPGYSYLADTNHASYLPVTDTQAIQAFQDLTRMEDILPTIGSAHATAAARLISGNLDEGLDRKPLIIVNVSGYGDKDIDTAARWFNLMGES